MRRLLSLTVIVLLVVVSAPGADAKKKKSLPLQNKVCGDEIYQSFRLDNDLLNCPADGLVIAQSGVTVDLNGHRVVGDGGPDDGISMIANGTATVKNGVIRNFDTGIVAFGVTVRWKIVNIVAELNERGIQVNGAGSVIKKSTAAYNNGIGFAVFAEESVLEAVRATGNESRGISLSGNRSRIVSSVVTGTEGTVDPGSAGIMVFSNDSKIIGNVVAHNGHITEVPGILVDDGATGNVVKGNEIYGNGDDGYRDDGTSNKAVDNLAHANGFFQGGSNGFGTGIDASAAITPLGSGNDSYGNDAADQCVPDPLCA